MTEQNNTQAQPQQQSSPHQNQSHQPDYIAYHVQQKGQDGKGYFHQVGAAWQHKDGKDYDVQLESMPVNGRITLREQRQEKVQHYQNQRQEIGQNGQNITQEKGRER